MKCKMEFIEDGDICISTLPLMHLRQYKSISDQKMNVKYMINRKTKHD